MRVIELYSGGREAVEHWEQLRFLPSQHAIVRQAQGLGRYTLNHCLLL